MARVLIIDNYDGFREAMEYCLPKFGHAVVAAASIEAFDPQLLGEWQPDLAVVGVGATPMDAFSVCARLRNSPDGRAIPVIVLANSISALVEAQSRALGVAAIIRKPFEWAELLSAIARAVH